jgi:hypothetical protein
MINFFSTWPSANWVSGVRVSWWFMSVVFRLLLSLYQSPR